MICEKYTTVHWERHWIGIGPPLVSLANQIQLELTLLQKGDNTKVIDRH